MTESAIREFDFAGLRATFRSGDELLRAGVSGYVLKQSPPSELLQAIRATGAGGQYLDSSLTARVTAGFLGRESRSQKSAGSLSDREAEVLRLIALGHTNTEIGQRLHLSVRTIESHRAHIQQKTRRTTRAELVRYALEHGLVEV